jgi:hypothetical protein
MSVFQDTWPVAERFISLMAARSSGGANKINRCVEQMAGLSEESDACTANYTGTVRT